MKYLNKLWLKKKFYFTKTLSDYNFVEGNVIKIFYIARYKRKKRYYSFIGLCLSKNIWKFLLTNLMKRQRIFFLFPLIGPSILKIFTINKYKLFVGKVRKISYKSNLILSDDLSVFINRIFSTEHSIKYHLTDYFYSRFWSRAKRKRYVKKHRYNKSWQECYTE
jgi:hypothetical protein